MQANIKQLKPGYIYLQELRPGDNFELEGWVYKVLTGIGKFTPDGHFNKFDIFCVVESSGEVVMLDHDSRVYPLLEVEAQFEYDFDRNFEKAREE